MLKSSSLLFLDIPMFLCIYRYSMNDKIIELTENQYQYLLKLS